MEVPNRDIEAALTKKGFIKRRGGDHNWFDYPDSTVSTKTSHGSGKTSGDHLLTLMAVQTRLTTKARFLDLVNCPLSKENYREILQKAGLLNQPKPKPPKSKKKSTGNQKKKRSQRRRS